MQVWAAIVVATATIEHGSGTSTLDGYGRGFENRLDEVADAVALPVISNGGSPNWNAGERVIAEPVEAAVAKVLPIEQPSEQLFTLLRPTAAGQTQDPSGTPNGIRTRATAVKVEIKPDGTLTVSATFD